MKYEQKYKEALERARKLYERGTITESLGHVFPELKESEEERIRKGLIKYFKNFDSESLYTVGLNEEEILVWLEKQGEKRKITHEEICQSYGIPNIGEFSDGYHTFNGLYKQRMILFAVLVKTYKDKAWKSWKHEDGLDCFGGGWFIVGIDTPEGTYTYHYEAKDWDRFDCKILEKAKHWDGHDEFDVERLFSLVSNTNKDEVIRCTWLEKQSEQCVPSKEMILNVWELGNIWKEITKGICNTEYGTQLDYILKHWTEGEHYTEWLEKQDKENNTYVINNTPNCGISVHNEELKESEDEKVRKELVDAIQGLWDNDALPMPLSTKRKDEWLAWLEKKRKQKPIIDGILTATNFDKMFQNCNVHKFNVGDWIVDKSGLTQQVLDFRGGIYTCTYNSFTTDCESNYHLWTIQDAKPGDVLASKDNSSILIFRNLDSSTSFSSYYNIEGKGELGWSNKCFIPATKKQREILFKTMEEAGYEWNDKKKKTLQKKYIWYSALEEPDEQREILVEYISEDVIKHDVAYYHKDTDSFLKNSVILNDVIKWCYLDELIKHIGKLSWV